LLLLSVPGDAPSLNFLTCLLFFPSFISQPFRVPLDSPKRLPTTLFMVGCPNKLTTQHPTPTKQNHKSCKFFSPVFVSTGKRPHQFLCYSSLPCCGLKIWSTFLTVEKGGPWSYRPSPHAGPKKCFFRNFFMTLLRREPSPEICPPPWIDTGQTTWRLEFLANLPSFLQYKTSAFLRVLLAPKNLDSG